MEDVDGIRDVQKVKRMSGFPETGGQDL